MFANMEQYRIPVNISNKTRVSISNCVSKHFLGMLAKTIKKKNKRERNFLKSYANYVNISEKLERIHFKLLQR